MQIIHVRNKEKNNNKSIQTKKQNKKQQKINKRPPPPTKQSNKNKNKTKNIQTKVKPYLRTTSNKTKIMSESICNQLTSICYFIRINQHTIFITCSLGFLKRWRLKFSLFVRLVNSFTRQQYRSLCYQIIKLNNKHQNSAQLAHKTCRERNEIFLKRMSVPGKGYSKNASFIVFIQLRNRSSTFCDNERYGSASRQLSR